jgi:hypothetical protein
VERIYHHWWEVICSSRLLLSDVRKYHMPSPTLTDRKSSYFVINWRGMSLRPDAPFMSLAAMAHLAGAEFPNPTSSRGESVKQVLTILAPAE